MSTSFWQSIKTRLAFREGRPPETVQPPVGLSHYLIENPGEQSRVHLRVDRDGSGVLLINANRVFQLNPTAVLMASLFLQKIPLERCVQIIRRTYSVGPEQARADLQTFNAQLAELIRPDGACPLHELELETTAPFSARPSAPYRMDLALTYRCNNNCAHCYNVRESIAQGTAAATPAQNIPELSTNSWKKVIERTWALGIPHIVFTGGEPTLRNDLPDLIAYAQAQGQVTGLNTNARRLADPGFVRALVDAGLDHVQITVESHDAAVHDRLVCAQGAWKQTLRGLQNALATRLYVMTNTTLLQENGPHLADTLDFLAANGVPTVGLNALIYAGRGASVGTGLPESALTPLLEIARQKTQAARQRLIWYTPTEYCRFDPMQLELGVKGCTAALYNMCIEPNGDVLPCQSYYHALGNLLHDPWESIWNHELSVHLRERHYIAEKCLDCSLLAECGGGCPLQTEISGMQAAQPARNSTFVRPSKA
ncbi:MAG: PqqD family peptide modification chaperone [Chloroflexota bacterium]